MEAAVELRRLVEGRQNGSVIVIGGPGSGKTNLVRRVTREVNTVFLDGLLCNDFYTNLAHLSKCFNGGSSESGCFEDFAESLIQLHGQKELSFSVVVIEWLETFVEGGQQLLYGLLELSVILPLLVIGLTRRVDVAEGMEKRVRSRFSQSFLYLEHSTADDNLPNVDYDLAVPELLVMVAVHRVLLKKSRMDSTAILSEYYNGVKGETDGSLLTTSIAHGDRHLLLAIESLIARGLLKYARNDYWVERQSRPLLLTLPLFVLPQLLLNSPACPIPLRHLIQQQQQS